MAKKREYWSDEDVEVLKKFYPSLDYKSMFENLSSTRDIRSIQEKAKRLKIRASKYWTKDQLGEFKKRYPIEGASVSLCKKFKRSKHNLWAVAKTLGLKSL